MLVHGLHGMQDCPVETVAVKLLTLRTKGSLRRLSKILA